MFANKAYKNVVLQRRSGQEFHKDEYSLVHPFI